MIGGVLLRHKVQTMLQHTLTNQVFHCDSFI